MLIPASLSRKEEAEWVETMVARLREVRAPPQAQRRRPDEAGARRSATATWAGWRVPESVRWVDNQESRWGSCTPGDRIDPALRAAAGHAGLGDRLRADARARAPARARPRRGVLGLGGPLPAGRAGQGLPARLVGRRPRSSRRRARVRRRLRPGQPLERPGDQPVVRLGQRVDRPPAHVGTRR